MKVVTEYLEQLDLSESEAKLYLTLLEIGPLDVRTLAQRLGIKRTTAYTYTDQLIERGFVIKLVEKSVTKVAAIQPEESLPYLVEQKAQVSKTMQNALPQIIDALHTAFPLKNRKTSEEPEIKYYKGKLGVKKIYEDALQSKELRSYVNVAIMYDHLPENSLVFAKALKENTTIKIFEIIEDSAISRKQTEYQTNNANQEGYRYKFLPQEVKLSAADTLIYDNKVAIINVGDTITGVVLHNSDYYKNSRELFDFNWRMLPEVKK